MVNFVVRFLYFFFFEIFLCILIHTATAYEGSELLLVLSLVIFVALVSLIVLLCSLFCSHGPYMVPKSYEKNSLKGSWWGIRPLCQDGECFELPVNFET